MICSQWACPECLDLVVLVEREQALRAWNAWTAVLILASHSMLKHLEEVRRRNETGDMTPADLDDDHEPPLL